MALRKGSHPIPSRRIGRTNLEVTELGIGCTHLGFATSAGARPIAQSIERALTEGVRLVDTAPNYGQGLSELRLGEVLRGRPRQSYVLSTKVGKDVPYAETGVARPEGPPFDYSYGATLRQLEASLRRLDVSSIDIALIHDLGRRTHGDDHERTFKVAMDGAYRALDELKCAGHIAAVGLGVNETEVLIEAAAQMDADCFLLAGRYTLLEQGALDELLPLCIQRHISVLVGGVFNSGILATGVKVHAKYDYAPAPDVVRERVKDLELTCASHGVTLSQAALQFPLLHPAVAAVIFGPKSVEEVASNLASFRSPIPSALWSDLKDRGLLDPRAPVSC